MVAARNWLAAGVALQLCAAVCAQDQVRPGSIRGTVTDKDLSVPLGGAVITILETGQLARSSDQGAYVFPQVKPGRYTVLITADGYQRFVRPDVLVGAGQLVEVAADLAGDFTDLEEFVVQDIAGAGAGSEASLLQMRLESAALMDSVGSDLMSKAGASDAAAALRLVAGATVQDGKSAVVRGLPDRYVSSQLNGVRLPTADENKRAVELDQFPASVIESIQVSKTFTPDQQGDASGGAVDVRLKGIPSEPFFFQMKSQTGFNTQAAGRDDFLSYSGGGVNFFGSNAADRAPQPVGQSWTGAMGVSETEAPIDSKWSLSTGGRTRLSRSLQFGGSASLFYERDSQFYDNGIDDSYWVKTPGAPMSPRELQGRATQGDFRTALFDVTQGKQSVQWGGLGTLGLKGDRFDLDLAYLYSRSSEDVATEAVDTRGKAHFFPGHDPHDPNSPGYNESSAAPYLRLETLQYTERTTDSLQLKGKHRLTGFAGSGTQAPELAWAVSHNSAAAVQPDKRQFGEAWLPGGPNLGVHIPYKPAANFTIGNAQHIYKNIDEESWEYGTDLKVPFEPFDKEKGWFKVGLFEDRVHRAFDQDTFSNFGDNSNYQGPFEAAWSRAFPGQNHAITASNYDVDYDGDLVISAAYAMVDMPLGKGIELIGGARFENTAIDIVNTPDPGATWYPPGSTAPVVLNPGDADVSFEEARVLPSLSLVWRPSKPLTLRAAYSQTLARQTFKELTPILQQEYLGGPIFIGNPDLGMSSLDNYDLRAEYAAFEGSILAFSWFRKDVDQPIEYVQTLGIFDYTTARNYPKGRLDGVELEARQALGELLEPLQGWTIGANATVLQSKVWLPDDEVAGFNRPEIRAPMSTRDMTNAPTHLYNLFSTYDVPGSGTQLGLFYTITGDTLVAGAGQVQETYVPSVYATQFDTLNASITQSLGRFFKLQLQGKNLTNPEIRTVYRSDYIDGDVTKTSYTKGAEFSLALTFEARF